MNDLHRAVHADDVIKAREKMENAKRLLGNMLLAKDKERRPHMYNRRRT